jgi:hypothetical protein
MVDMVSGHLPFGYEEPLKNNSIFQIWLLIIFANISNLAIEVYFCFVLLKSYLTSCKVLLKLHE